MTWRHFKLDDFKCHHCGENRMVTSFIDLLDELREQVGFPIIISSGYRCPEYNKMVSTTGETGPHTTGQAADLLVNRGKAYAVLRQALNMGFTGIGVSQKGSTRFLHLDTLPDAPGQPRPTCWSY